MYTARFIIIVLLILVILVGYNPHMRENARTAWEDVRPVVVDLMDNTYAAIRTLIAGTDAGNRTNDPGAPGIDFDRIVTMSSGAFL